jgi:hypothetical protein
MSIHATHTHTHTHTQVMSIQALDQEKLLQFGMTFSPTSNVRGRVRATDTADKAIVSAQLEWWPQVSHGAVNMSVCFQLLTYQDPGRRAVAPQERCVVLSVARCRYEAADGDDIKKIAKVFKVDWLTLWGLNSNLPSLHTPPGKEIMIGRIYQVGIFFSHRK